MKVSPTHWPPLPTSSRRYSWYSFDRRVTVLPEGLRQLKNHCDLTGNRTCDLPACTLNNSESGQKNFSVPLPTATVPRCPFNLMLIRSTGQSRCFGEQINVLPAPRHYAVPAGSNVYSWREWAVLVESNVLLLLQWAVSQQAAVQLDRCRSAFSLTREKQQSSLFFRHTKLFYVPSAFQWTACNPVRGWLSHHWRSPYLCATATWQALGCHRALDLSMITHHRVVTGLFIAPISCHAPHGTLKDTKSDHSSSSKVAAGAFFLWLTCWLSYWLAKVSPTCPDPPPINPLKPKRRPLYLKPQCVSRCKHFSYRL